MPESSQCEATYIKTNQQLALFCQQWQLASLLALDTEFIRTDTFYPIVGLIQLSDGENCFLIDPLTIDQWQPFIDLMTDINIPKVLHSCSEDLEVFDRLLGVLPTPLFDTQIAAAMVGLDFSMSYQRLVDAMLSIHVEKGETRSNWLRRPLTQSQCHYAALDVEHLPTIYSQLSDRLNENGRMHWLTEECEKLIHNFYETTPYYQKVKSAWKLSAKQLLLLDRLTEWREHQARKRNIPRGRVIKDIVCFDLAVKSSRSLADLAKFKELDGKTIRIDGDAIMAIIDEVKNASPDQYPKLLPKPLPLQMGATLKTLKAAVQVKAEELVVAQEILVKKRDYEALLRSGIGKNSYSLPESLLGWRKDVIGDELLALL